MNSHDASGGRAQTRDGGQMHDPAEPGAADAARAEARAAAFWGSFRMFETLPRSTRIALSRAAQPRDWAQGAMLFQRGDEGDYLIAISEGRVRLSVGTAQGRELTLRHAGPGDLLGEMALFDGEPRSADAFADLPTRGYVLSRGAVLSLAAAEPDLMPGVARYLCQRLRETTDQLEGIALYSLEARMARFILFTLRQIHGDDLPPMPRLRLEITQSELAAVLGASRPKVNRALQSLRDSAALVRQDDVLACDVARLTALAEPEAE